MENLALNVNSDLVIGIVFDDPSCSVVVNKRQRVVGRLIRWHQVGWFRVGCPEKLDHFSIAVNSATKQGPCLPIPGLRGDLGLGDLGLRDDWFFPVSDTSDGRQTIQPTGSGGGQIDLQATFVRHCEDGGLVHTAVQRLGCQTSGEVTNGKCPLLTRY